MYFRITLNDLRDAIFITFIGYKEQIIPLKEGIDFYSINYRMYQNNIKFLLHPDLHCWFGFSRILIFSPSCLTALLITRVMQSVRPMKLKPESKRTLIWSR